MTMSLPHRSATDAGPDTNPARRLLRLAGSTWDRLIAAFCDVIAPLLARFIRERRLIAVASPSGDLTFSANVDGSLVPLSGTGPIEDRLSSVRWTAVDLRLPAEQVLVRHLALPAASRDFLAPIVAHRLDRLSPWDPAQVLYGFAADAEPGSANLAVSVAITSREAAASAVERLERLGLKPTTIGSADAPLDVPPPIDLLSGRTDDGRAHLRHMVSRIAAALLIASCVAATASVIWQSQAADRLVEVQTKLARAQHMLRAMARGQRGSAEASMLFAKQPDKAVVVLLNRLAATLPSDTYLREMTLSSDKLRLVGSSANAPALIGLLDKAGLVNPRFTSPVTRGKDDRDAFEITADRHAVATEAGRRDNLRELAP